jgi:acyl dehydratase/NAD(P)-dependent dehydrogenase (short-subunit alcohol dehydrogenase family)
MTNNESQPVMTLASRTFGEHDQALFARLSADFNPLHIDPVAARRTDAGAPVVHGIHAALWALDKLVEAGAVADQIVSLRVQFTKFIYVGGTVDLRLLHRDEKSITAELALNGLTKTTLVLGLGTRKQSAAIAPPVNTSTKARVNGSANVLRIEEMADLSGCMDFATPAGEIGRLFPHAASVIGCRRVAAIALLSRLVGMICPGLHSIFSAFTIELVNDLGNEDGIRFHVSKTHNKFRMVRMDVSGAGICGNVQAFVRQPPIAQAASSDIVKIVSPTEFAGSTALIIGGSRGLGEVTAKVIAAGGGKVIVTYATGREDALRLTEEIGREVAPDMCHAFRFEARENIANQLSAIGDCKITHLYYFATPRIFRQKEGLFVKSTFDDFLEVYVKGFYDCCRFLADHGSRPLIANYPSSVFVDEHPLTMTEYSMAKAAGEMLCADMNRSDCGIHVVVSRLPPLLTDQTATVIPVETADPLEVMLPIIRNVQSLRPSS